MGQLVPALGTVLANDEIKDGVSERRRPPRLKQKINAPVEQCELQPTPSA